VQNAYKYTRPHSHVTLRTVTTADHVRIQVEDECGGLPPGKVETLFLPFEQGSADHSGLGLGLAICVRGVKAIGGALRVQDLPTKGCVFEVELPRAPAGS
jgi:signal transduction histidine kinase